MIDNPKLDEAKQILASNLKKEVDGLINQRLELIKYLKNAFGEFGNDPRMIARLLIRDFKIERKG